MKVSPEKIKARRSQFQKEGVKVLDALELNAGVKLADAIRKSWIRERFSSRGTGL